MTALPPRPRRLALRILGPFAASVDGRQVGPDRWSRRKPLALVKLLAVSPRHRLHREQVLDLLWPELDADAASNQLYKALHGARRALEPGLAPRAESAFVVVADGVVQLVAPEGLTIDADEFEATATAALAAGDLAQGEEGLELYVDDVLPEDRFAEWAEPRRERLKLLRLRLLTHVAELYAAAGDLDRAVARFDQLVALDPSDEAAHRSLIGLYARAGHRGDAARQLEVCRAALGRELDAEPEPSTVSALETPPALRANPRPRRSPVPVPAPVLLADRIALWRRALVLSTCAMLVATALLPVASASGRLRYRLGRFVSKAEQYFAGSADAANRLLTVRGRLDRPGARVEALDSLSGWATIADPDGTFTVLDLQWSPGSRVDLLVTSAAGSARLFTLTIPDAYPDGGSLDAGSLTFVDGRAVETEQLFGVNSISYLDFDAANGAYYRGVFDGLALGRATDEERIDAVNRFVASRYNPDQPRHAERSPRATLEAGSSSSGPLSLAMATVCRAGGYPVRLVDMVAERGARQSHRIVEVFYNGRWHLYDPSYGLSMRDAAGRVVGYTEVRHNAELLAAVPFASVERIGWETDRMPELFASGIFHLYMFRPDGEPPRASGPSLDGA